MRGHVPDLDQPRLVDGDQARAVIAEGDAANAIGVAGQRRAQVGPEIIEEEIARIAADGQQLAVG